MEEEIFMKLNLNNSKGEYSMKFFFCLALLVFSSSFSQAQNRVGNGGDVILCDNKAEGKTVKILDLYELETSTPKKELFSLTSNSKDEWTATREIFERLKPFAPKLFDQYVARLKSIQSEIDFKPDIRLSNVKDSEHLYLPKSKKCKLYQIAIRKNTVTKEEKRFVVDEELWKELNTINRSALISHEIIYEHLFKLGETNSVKARKIVGLLFSKDLESKKFWKLIQELEVSIYP